MTTAPLATRRPGAVFASSARRPASSTGSPTTVAQRLPGALHSHVSSEQVLEALALPQARDHAVEARLGLADLPAVVDRHIDRDVTFADTRLGEPELGDRFGD